MVARRNRGALGLSQSSWGLDRAGVSRFLGNIRQRTRDLGKIMREGIVKTSKLSQFPCRLVHLVDALDRAR